MAGNSRRLEVIVLTGMMIGVSVFSAIEAEAVDRTVGAGCTYATIQAAITAAVSGDRLLIEGGVVFNENVTVTKDLVLQGGYAGCASGSSARTTLDGNAGGSVIIVNPAMATITVSLLNLEIINGSSVLGGGLWIGQDAEVIGENVEIYGNTATSSGGGIYAAGSTLTLTNAHVGGTGHGQPNQLGPDGQLGAGLHLTNGTQATLNNTVISGNAFQTIGYTYGGGLYVENDSEVTMNASLVEDHQAPSDADGRGAGIYINDSTVTLDNSQVISNTAGTVGGGVRLWGTSMLNILNGSVIAYNQASNGQGGAIAAGSTPTINIANATIRNNTSGTDGGAIYISNGTLDFTGTWTLRENTAGGNGGAVAAAGTAVVNFRVGGDSLVYFNRAQGGHGGMIHLGNNTTTRLYATTGSQMYIYANQADGNGGALYADSGGYFDIYGDVSFDRNRADNGGAIFLSNGSRVWLDDYINILPQFWDNRADNGSGGAIHAVDSLRVECDGAIFGKSGDGNQASVSGGAIFLDTSTFNADNCRFEHNQAQEHGGAIAAFDSTLDIFATYLPPTAGGSLSLTVKNTELSRDTNSNRMSDFTPTNATGLDSLSGEASSLNYNVADSDESDSGDGGAIFSSNSTLTLTQTYLHHNSAHRGGAIFQTGAAAEADISNSLIHHNMVTLALGAGIRQEGGGFTITHTTLADNIGGSGFSGLATEATNTISWGNDGYPGFTIEPATSACNIDDGGKAGINVDPQFRASGADGNYRLRSSSPAIDACALGLEKDLDNRLRPNNGLYDMGAYEFYPYGLNPALMAAIIIAAEEGRNK